MDPHTLISVIIPIYNGTPWISKCFHAILQQELPSNINIEICVCNDASTDSTTQMLEQWKNIFKESNMTLKVYNNKLQTPKGVGYSKNKAVSVSNGTYFCFQDVDDIMLPNRIIEQYNHAKVLPCDMIIGSQFKRFPEDSTQRYTQWANSLSNRQLHVQIYTSHGPTVIMPTWFCHRSVFDRVGGFSEDGKGTPEDLIFFYKHLDLGGKLFRVNKSLLIYTYHPNAVTFSVHENTIWNIRIKRLQEVVLSKWQNFTIWNAGKQGRKFYNSLSQINQTKVLALCDIDTKKIGRKYVAFDPVTRQSSKAIDILHFKDATAPFVICMKMNLTNGEFEKNLNMLNLTEDVDYVLFS